jgi:hypothetical protein
MSPNPNVSFEDTESDAALVDMSGVSDEGTFECLPRGIYPCLVDEVTYGQSQRSGNNMWTWVFEVEEGDYAGRKLFFHTPFVETTMPRLKKVLGRISPELLSTKFNPAKLADENYFVGKRCRVRVDIKKYEGVNRNNVRDVLAASEGASEAFM